VLFQIAVQLHGDRPKAVLEQPSSRRVRWDLLGRRNIALSQSDELNQVRRDTPARPLAHRDAVLKSSVEVVAIPRFDAVSSVIATTDPRISHSLYGTENPLDISPDDNRVGF